MTCISTCSLPAVLRCLSVGYFVTVSSLWGASFDRTIAARAIRSRFFVARLEMDLVKLVELGLGASYRYTSAATLPATPKNAMEGFSASLSIKVGVF